MKNLICLLALALAGCISSLTVPVVVIEKSGRVLHGTATGGIWSGAGSFRVWDGKLSCRGDYDAHDTSSAISMIVTCSDGRRGIATGTKSGLSGSGTVRMTDGDEATFLFGRAAQDF